MVKKKFDIKQALVAGSNVASKATSWLAGLTVGAFLVGFVLNLALDGVERKERRVKTIKN